MSNVLKIVTALGPRHAYMLAIPPAKIPVAPTSFVSGLAALYLYAKLIAHTVTLASTHSSKASAAVFQVFKILLLVELLGCCTG